MTVADQSPGLCALCAVEEEPGADEAPSVAYLDGEVVALIESGTPGVILAPRSHVGALSTVPAMAGRFLAALRRTVTEVQTTYGTSGATIEPSTDLEGSMGHVCYRVFPTFGIGSVPEPEVGVGVEGLALALASY